MGKLRSLTFKYLTTNAFWDYMEEYYFLKLIWVVVRYNFFPYVGQDTNATIERYYKTLNFQLKVEKSKMVGHHMDQRIHKLTRRLYVKP